MRTKGAILGDVDDCIREAESILDESVNLDRAHRLALDEVKQIPDGRMLRDLQRTYLQYRNELAHRLALNAQRAERLLHELRRR
jgi:hypothetical protein